MWQNLGFCNILTRAIQVQCAISAWDLHHPTVNYRCKSFLTLGSGATEKSRLPFTFFLVYSITLKFSANVKSNLKQLSSEKCW
jgi:hypothetical protein